MQLEEKGLKNDLNFVLKTIIISSNYWVPDNLLSYTSENCIFFVKITHLTLADQFSFYQYYLVKPTKKSVEISIFCVCFLTNKILVK